MLKQLFFLVSSHLVSFWFSIEVSLNSAQVNPAKTISKKLARNWISWEVTFKDDVTIRKSRLLQQISGFLIGFPRQMQGTVQTLDSEIVSRREHEQLQ